ncbi:uncharacterized protein CANTADRAFT_26065 [Suhomyces tanzawaensis NRRL Y-17324]|uniref:Uncharacterized protein n=1 Tax=Suhomyces tanzawaensis NRRL Y-17324 TaxID=984487 RepID=A0A1E4SHJ0_9ASCO|nr:uncharacterized protein CANTADRAFT_26065 [Suhomyces tanzawaensis NRRL Y-17324]ODV78971.1 hypothetical protein CANTADRAFT_26065 [Suhomyces tanzawaensis NRRL Y-17324]
MGQDIDTYIKVVWMIISATSPSSPQKRKHALKKFHDFSNKYSSFIDHLIYNSQLTPTNLIISLYFLYKYHHHNHVLQFAYNEHVIPDEHESINIYLVVMSLILSNKSFDDQSYTLKTWLNIINNTLCDENPDLVKVDLKLLNSLEGHFLSCLDYKLSFNGAYGDKQFWSLLATSTVFRLPTSSVNKYKKLLHNDTPVEPAQAVSSYVASPGYSCAYTTSSVSPKHGYRTPPSISRASSPLDASFSSCTLSKMGAVGYSPLTPLTPCYSDYNYKRRQLHSLQQQAMVNAAYPAAHAGYMAHKYQPKPVYYMVPQQAQFAFAHQMAAPVAYPLHETFNPYYAPSTIATQWY